MNWTGGGLSRSRNAKKSLSSKQQQHFALKRAALQAHRSPQPINFDFDHCQSVAVTARIPPVGSVSKQNSLQQQTILDDFENTRPLAKKLQNLNNHHGSKKRKRSPLKPTDSHTKPGAPTDKGNSPIVISSRPPSVSSSLPSRTSKASQAQEQLDTSPDELSKTSIETKRRRLLQTPDWVGLVLRASEPVHMKFADPKDRDLIGRRRPVSKVNYKHPDGYQKPLKRTTKLDRHKLLPDTTNFCSIADDVSIRFGSAVDKSVRGYDERYSDIHEPAKPRGLAFPDEYFSVLSTNKSYRIGGTVDRSVRDEAERVSICKPLAESHTSDEILDLAEIEPVQSPRPAVSAVRAGFLGRTSLSDYGHRDILTPSAFMDDSSSSPMHPTHSSSDVEDFRAGKTPSSSRVYMKTHPATYGSEWNLPDLNEQALEGPRLRLVVQSTPQSHVRVSQFRGSSPVCCNIALGTSLGSIVPLGKPIGSTAWHDGYAGGRHVPSDPSLESLAVTTPPLDMASSQLLTEIHNYEYRNARRLKITKDKSHSLYTPRGKYREYTVNSETIRPASKDNESQTLAQTKAARQEQSRSAQEEEEVWRRFIAPSDLTVDQRLLGAPQTATNASKSTLKKGSTHTSALPSSVKQPHQTTEEEENIWKNFIFSDEDEHNGWTIEESQPQAISPYDPLEQASIILESPQDFNSILAEASDILTEFDDIINSSMQAPERLGQSVPLPSSLVGQASSASVPRSSIPQQVSSDELGLGWSPTRTQLSAAKAKEPKVVFTRPKRYVRERAGRPAEPVHIGGRVLRNGKRTSAKGGRRQGCDREDEGEKKRKTAKTTPAQG